MHLLVLIDDDVLVDHLRDIRIWNELRAVWTALKVAKLVRVLDFVLVKVRNVARRVVAGFALLDDVVVDGALG